MILVNKAAAGPARLAAGVPLTAEICDAYDSAPGDYDAGHQVFKFRTSIYGHHTVKRALRTAQFDKCCYCEGKFTGHSPGDVEHFRPKGRVRQTKGAPFEYPGYYWLAYDWANLFFCCIDCNRSAKLDYFPLEDPARRARNHADDLTNERPLILNPAGEEDPTDHIGFHEEVPIAITPLGRSTIVALKLDDRPELNERRREHFNILKILKEIVRVCGGDTNPEFVNLVADAQSALDRAILPEAPFSAMARALIDAP